VQVKQGGGWRRGGKFKFYHEVGTVARRLVLVTKVDLNAKLWDITTRWDLRWMHDRAAPLTGSLKVGLRTSGSMGSGSLRVATARFLKPKEGAGRLAHKNDRHGPKEVKSPSKLGVICKSKKKTIN